MKLHAKSFFSSLSGAGGLYDKASSRVRARRSPGSRFITSTNLAALAAELNDSATQGLFEYPRNWVTIAKVCGMVLIAGTILRLLLLVRTTLEATGRHIPIEYLAVTPWQLAAAVVCMLLAIVFAALLVGLFPSIRITPQGLGMSQLFGWRRVAWSQIGILRVMDLDNDRYVLFIPFRGATNPPTPAPIFQLIPALAGASRTGDRGLMVTSDISDFDRLVQLIVSYVAQAGGQNVPHLEMFLDEAATFPLAQLVLEPRAAILRWARPKVATDVYGSAVDQVEPPLPWRTLLSRQLLVALPPAILLLLTVSLHGLVPVPRFIWVLLLIAMGLGELPFLGKVIQAVGDMMVGNGIFGRALWAYLELQVPRAVLIVTGTALVGMGMPDLVANVCWLAGIGITTMLTMQYVQRAYYITPTQAVIAGVGSFMYQVVLVALYFGIS